ncbi:MAG: chitobiase/beta-hexosaminidase C-terminal domain-containing protein, partial [Paludibacteraceae bacterium]|nr:chitobiase/beta-hexosaminidase C-terminal domain-containing protein [Paludibacteraceae bacterium]
MKHLLSLERLDVGRTLALTVGSPSAHRRGTMLKPLFLAMLFLIAGIGNVWGADAGAITVSTSSIILPSGSTSTTTWNGSGAPAYDNNQNSDENSNITINNKVVGSLRFYHAGYSGTACQLQKNNGYVEVVISSSAGIDVDVKMVSNGKSGTITAALTGATSQTVTGQTAAVKSLSTTNTSATLKITCSSNAAKIYYIQITPKSGSQEPTGCVAPTFSPAAGTYTSTQSVTISTETKGATIYYTTDGSAPDNTKTEYTGAISVSSTQTIKAIATKSGLDNSSVASAEYKIYPVVHAGTSADPYTVADARNAIDANTGTSNVYVTGKVSNVVGNSLPGWITYDISVDGETTSDQFRVYKGKSTSGNNFTSADDIQVGDVVVVYGSITYYSKESLYEFSSNSQLISLSRVVIVSLYNGANGATKVDDFESGTDALPTTAADVAGWTFDGNWSKNLFASKTNSQAYASGTYFAGGAEEYSGTNLYAIYRRTPTGGSAIYSTQPTPGYPLSLDPATGDLSISANKDLAFIPVGESVILSAVGGLVTTWTVYDSDVNDITSSFTYTSSSNTSFVFDMPAQEILVEATMCALPAVP